jgi:hypothetical protein
MMASQELVVPRLLVGAVKRLITPTIRGRHVFVAGGEHARAATDIHDELWARAVAVRYGDVTLVLIALDLLGLGREHTMYVREQALAEGLPAENLIISCTRNHAGPDTFGRWSEGHFGSGLNLRYLQFLRSELVEIIRLVVESLEPAQAFLARRQIVDLCDDRSRELSVLQFRALHSEAVATLVNLPLIPQVLDEENTSISADFAHWLYDGLDSSRDHVTLYLCGEGSDGAVPFRARSWQEAQRIGSRLAEFVKEILVDSSPVVIDRLDVRRVLFVVPSGNGTAKWLRRVRRVAGQDARRAHTSEMGLIQLGPARMAAVPGLVAWTIGDQVRKMLDAPYRFVIGVSNDDLGFIPPQPLPGTSREHESHVGTVVLDELDRLLLDVSGGIA